MAKKKEPRASPFVPVEEQPYSIPENWCWVKLEDISEIIMGQSPVGSDTTDDSSYMPLIGGAVDMGIMYPLATRYTKVPTKISENGDLILCIRATLGKPIFSDGEYCLGRGVAAVRPYNGPKEYYRYYFLNFEQYLYDNATGTTFAQISSKILQKMPVPFSPLPEQHRIVARIESLFAKLDEAKEKAQAVVDCFELRKAAILHKAFTGELTKRWRKEHGVGLDNWTKAELKNLSSAIGDGLHGTPIYCNSGKYYFINGNNFSGKTIVIKPDTKKVDYSEYERHKVELSENTVFVSINGTLGKTAFYNNEPVILGKSACYINVNKKLNKYFLRFFLCSKEFIDYANENATGSTIKNLGLKAIRNLPIYLPVVEEQLEIVQILEKILEKEQKVKEAAVAVLDQINTMKKAILARAFRGELGTNDPEEENASGLIKSVLYSEESNN